jgi:hypothetical protein
MLNLVKTTKLNIQRTSLLCGLLFAAAFALLPISAGAQCGTSWDASGTMGVRQRGIRYGITFEMQQKGRVITGNAHGTVDNSDGGVDTLKGTIDGTIDGDNFSVQIFWTNGQTGIYTAKILPSGRLDGEAYEKNSPSVRVPWNSNGVLKCPPPTAPKPIRSTGKAKPAPTPPPPTPPFIIAGQVVIPTPNHPFGIASLGWDGGPDHPDVAVWLSIDNGAEVPAFSMEHPAQSPIWRQPKASIPLQLQRKHHYRFVLKGAGKTLSTVAFVVP